MVELPLLWLPSENYQYTVLESLPVRSVVAKIKAADADIGSNAEMDYRIMDSDGPGVFNVSTDEDTQDGIITLLKVTTWWRSLRTAGGGGERTSRRSGSFCTHPSLKSG